MVLERGNSIEIFGIQNLFPILFHVSSHLLKHGISVILYSDQSKHLKNKKEVNIEAAAAISF